MNNYEIVKDNCTNCDRELDTYNFIHDLSRDRKYCSTRCELTDKIDSEGKEWKQN